MKFDQLAVLFPCDSLEDFDLRRSEHDAQQLLAAWSALWHPLLLSAVGKIPQWLPAASPPDPTGHLIVLPDCCGASLPDGWLEQAGTVDASVLRHIASREQLVAEALRKIDADPAGIDAELAADFLALGYCHLQVELLTAQAAIHEQPGRVFVADGGSRGSRTGRQRGYGGGSGTTPGGLRPALRSP